MCEPTNNTSDGHPDLHFNNPNDGRYMAAVHPTAVLALIQRVRRAESALRDANAHIDELRGRLSDTLDERDRLALNQDALGKYTHT